MGKPVSVITGAHSDGVLTYAINAPDDKADDTGMADTLLYEIAKLGADGVTVRAWESVGDTRHVLVIGTVGRARIPMIGAVSG